MDTAALQEFAQQLAQHLRCRDEALCLNLVRELAHGVPVVPQEFAAERGISDEALTQYFSAVPDLEHDDAGNIVAWGLSLTPTAHEFRFNGQTLHTWCALDTFMYTALLQVSSQVASRCPVTDTPIALTLSNGEVNEVEPVTTVISVVDPTPEVNFDCRRASFCNHGHFFATPEAAAIWQKHHPGTVIFSAAEAFRLGQLVVGHRERAAQQIGA